MYILCAKECNVNVTSLTGKGTLEQPGCTRWQARRCVIGKSGG